MQFLIHKVVFLVENVVTAQKKKGTNIIVKSKNNRRFTQNRIANGPKVIAFVKQSHGTPCI